MNLGEKEMPRAPRYSSLGEKPGRKSWRGGGKDKTAAPRAAKSATWSAGSRQQVPSWVRAGILGIVALVLTAVYVVAFFFWPHPTPLVCALITDYESPLPPQAF